MAGALRGGVSGPAWMSARSPRDAADFSRRWSTLGAPQRPAAEVVAAMRPLVRGRGLQLGVTPEIAGLADRGVALDRDPAMIRLAWTGDTAARRAIVGDWRLMPFPAASFDVAFGDGCLSQLSWPGDYLALFGELGRVLAPGGRLVLRCFTPPDRPDRLEALIDDARRRRFPTFGAFKLRWNMAVADVTGSTANSGDTIHRLFDHHVGDRAELAGAAGWPRSAVDTIDFYAGACSIHSYPPRAALAGALPSGVAWRYLETQGYDGTELCPLLVVDWRDSRT